ncbi:hypothetical protein [Microbacterium enclense]
MSVRTDELVDLARVLGVDLSREPQVADADDKEHADFIGTGAKRVRS